MRPILLVLVALVAACGSREPDPPKPGGDFGLLVMAHGGSDGWNKEVLGSIGRLDAGYPVEVAFGMADAVTIQDGVRRLEASGAKNVGVVRLFVSGESFLERTEQILGLREGAPPRPARVEPLPDQCLDGTRRPTSGPTHSMELWRIETRAAFAVSREGLIDAEPMGEVLADRARTLSRDPRREDVLILAHGPGDDAENLRWLQGLDARADRVRDALPFRRVKAMTLREDWPKERIAIEGHIRAFVREATADGRAIVIPFRVSGFGPYRDVLKELDYVADGRGLLPHAAVTQWVAEQADALRRGPFRSGFAP